MNTVFDGSTVNVFIAFAAGFITFFASCLLPLVPTYLSYLSGITLSDGKATKVPAYKSRIFLHGLAFTGGFLVVFMFFGLTATTAGKIFNAYKQTAHSLGGILYILTGLFMLGIIRPSILYKELRLRNTLSLSKFSYINAILVGIVFSFAWSPCIGPILAVIILWVSQAQTVLRGVGLMVAYGLGLSLPFLITALFIEYVSPLIRKSGWISSVLTKGAALVILIAGILLLTGNIERFSILILQLLHMSKLAL